MTALRAIRAVPVAVLLGVLALVCGCGVGTEGAPRPVDSALFDPQPPPSVGGMGVALYFVRNDHLVAVHRRSAEDDRSRLIGLLAGVSTGDAGAGLRSAIPAAVRLRNVDREGTLLTVDLTGDLGEASADEQTLAIAQIVFTATENGVAAVQLLVDGNPVDVPRADGALASSELTRADFPTQAPLSRGPKASPTPSG